MIHLKFLLSLLVENSAVLISGCVISFSFILVAILVAVPFQIVRKLTFLWYSYRDKDIVKPVNAMGQITGRDFSDWFSRPSQAVNVLVKLKGEMKLENLRHIVLSQLVQKQKYNGSTNELCYPELQQFCVKKFGYLFFKWDREFDIKNHVRIYKTYHQLLQKDNDVITEDILLQIFEEVTVKPFSPNRSVWEILLIPSYQPKNWVDETRSENVRFSAFIFRIHHCIADGMAIYRLLMEMTDTGVESWERDIQRDNKNMLQNYSDILLSLKAFFHGPVSLLRVVFEGIDQFNPFHVPIKKLSGKCHVAHVNIDLKMIQKCRRKNNGISFNSVIISALSGALRRYMLESGIDSKKISTVRMGFPIPKPGRRSSELGNQYLSACLVLPVNLHSSNERLENVEMGLRRIPKDGMMPLVTTAQLVIGSFPVECGRALTKKSQVTVIYSGMKGPTFKLTSLNEEVEWKDLFFTTGLGTDDLGMAFCTLSYNDRINLVLTVDQNLLNYRTRVNLLLDYVVQEIEQLGNSECNDDNKISPYLRN